MYRINLNSVIKMHTPASGFGLLTLCISSSKPQTNINYLPRQLPTHQKDYEKQAGEGMALREYGMFIKRQLITYLSPAMSTADLHLYKLRNPSAGVTSVTRHSSKRQSPHSKANDPFVIFKSFGLFLAYQVPIQAGGEK